MHYLINWLAAGIFCAAAGYEPDVSPGDVVINEILFNPPGGGYDYVEGYNRSNKIINLENIVIAHRNSTGDISGMKPVAKAPVLIPPGAYFVVTANEKWLRQHYSTGPAAVVCEVLSLPSFPDDEGTVVLLNKGDSIIDELTYSEKWHFPLLTDVSGVSLERIDYGAPAQNRNNWSSASSSAGF